MFRSLLNSDSAGNVGGGMYATLRLIVITAAATFPINAYAQSVSSPISKDILPPQNVVAWWSGTYVQLHWDEDESGLVVGYHVYRWHSSATGGHWVPLTNGLFPHTTYLDFPNEFAVDAYYGIASVGASLNESEIAKVSARIGPQQMAPKGVTYNKNDIISDSQLLAVDTMTLSQIQNFLNNYNSGLATYSYGGKSAAQHIYDACKTHGVNPQLVLVTLQKEQQLITTQTPSAQALSWAMGWGSRSNFGDQIYYGTRQFTLYYNNLGAYRDVQGAPWEVGVPRNVYDGAVVAASKATAGLYIYTPYIGQGGGGQQGVGGNYLFWNTWYNAFSFGGGSSVQPPTVHTAAATNITSTSATLNATITNDGGGSVTIGRFEWIAGNVAGAFTGTPTADIAVTGNSFSYQLTNLSPNTTYTYRAWAKNSAGWNSASTLNNIVFTTESARTLTSLSIDGPSEPLEEWEHFYSCTARYSDGTTETVTGSAQWSENSPYASFNSDYAGHLITASVSADQSCRITASYGGKAASLDVIIKNRVENVSLTVNSSGPSGVAILSTSGHGGTTLYQVLVASSSSVNLSAPATDPAGYVFAFWKLGDVNHPAGQKSLNFTMTEPVIAIAVYNPAPSPTRVVSLGGDLSFGDVPVGSSAQRTLTISNTGNSVLNATGISYPSGFSGSWAGSIPAGGSQNVTVTFAPTAQGSHGGMATVACDATSGVSTISVSGNGTLAPTRIVSLSGNLSFGNVAVGASAQRTLTISNTGNSALTVTGISYPSGFSGNWTGSIPAGGSHNVTVTFAPTAQGSHGGMATVACDATSGVSTISVSGNGTLAPTRIVSLSGNLSFGNVAVGASAQRTLTISNTGNSALTVTGITYPPGFSGNWSGSIAPGSSQNVAVTFSPTSAVSYGGNLTVNCDYTGGTNTKAISGTGTVVTLPNLTPYQPSEWTDKIVVSNTTGATSDASSLYTTDMIYVNWAVVNNGIVPTATRFDTSLFVDGVEKGSWYTAPQLHAGSYEWVLDFSIGSLSAGTHTIMVRVDSTSAISESDERDNEYTKTITVNPPPGVANDNFANRAAISANGGVVTATNTGATKEAGEPNHAGKNGGKSLWWTWTPTVSGSAQVDTIGSGFDTLLGVYTGSSVSTLATVASDDDSGGIGTSRTAFNAVAGRAYQIAVDGYSGDSGNITLRVTAPVVTPMLSVTPDARDVGSTQGSTMFTVTNGGSGTLSWSASESLDWMTIQSPMSGSLGAGQSATVTVNYADTSGSVRSGNITFTAAGATGSPKSVAVRQAGGGCSGAKMLTAKIKEQALPQGLRARSASSVGSMATLALRLTADTAIDAASVWAAVEGPGYVANGGVWRATDPADGRDGWVLVAPTDAMPVGAVVTVTVGASTVTGEVVPTVTEQFLIDEGKAGAPVVGVSVDEASGVEGLPEILAARASSVYSIGQTGVFAAPVPVQIPVPAGVDPSKVDVYYYSESDATSGWYLGANVVGWMVPGSQKVVSDNGQTYIQFEVNHSGVVQLGQAIKAELGGVGTVDIGITGSGFSWAAMFSTLFTLSLALHRVGRGRRSRD